MLRCGMVWVRRSMGAQGPRLGSGVGAGAVNKIFFIFCDSQ